MSIIRIKENTSIEQVNTWFNNHDENITFEILHKSSFQLFAEGVALGVLKTLSINGKKIKIQFYKNPIINDDFVLDGFHSIFKTIFGLELLRLSISTLDNQGKIVDFRSIVGGGIWKSILKKNGYIGDGKNAYLISRHGYEIPMCLRDNETSNKFPRYDYFQSSMSSFLLGLRGYTNIIGPTEKKIIEWLHHIAENAYEHGSFSYKDEKLMDGFRGIVLGKLFFTKGRDEVEVRNDYPKFVKNYIKSLIKSGKCPTSIFTLNYITVMDLGDGIQNTVKLESSNSDFQKLCSAFEDGTTRKTKAMGEKSGYGLGQAVLAAGKLNALLHVVSGDIVTYIDLSRKDQEYKNIQSKFAFSQPENLQMDKRGTSISLLWLSESNSNGSL